MKKATVENGVIRFPVGHGFVINVEELSPDRPQVVADALERAYYHGTMDGADRVDSAAGREVVRIRNREAREDR